jgi:hypothetical protein
MLVYACMISLSILSGWLPVPGCAVNFLVLTLKLIHFSGSEARSIGLLGEPRNLPPEYATRLIPSNFHFLI